MVKPNELWRVWARCGCIMVLAILLLPLRTVAGAEDAGMDNARLPVSDGDLRYWLENMVWHHGYETEEIRAATGLSMEEIEAALKRFDIRRETKPGRDEKDELLVLPYPGGRHPRIGFLDGAIRPQRETKVSVFLPWDPASYVVLDVPEAIWSNLGLTYLAHTHIPTVWDERGRALERLEWDRAEDGVLRMKRRLPNGIEFGTEVRPTKGAVRMEMWLRNGSDAELTDLRVQNCVMLKGAAGFNQQTNENKVFEKPFVACRHESEDRWIISAWEPCHRPWANAPVPCLHSDPKFPDCPPGEERRLRGWLSFYEGPDLQGELKRIKAKW